MTSQAQSLVDVYVTECGALQQKPNSWVVDYLAKQEARHGNAASIAELNFSSTLLGRKGILPLISVILRCVMLRLLNLNGTGLNDFATSLLTAALMKHPSICIVFLKGNFITGDSLPALRKLTQALLDRAEKSPSPFAAVKRRNDETEFEIHIDPNPGIFESVVAELAVIRRSAHNVDLEHALAAPIPQSSAEPQSASALSRQPERATERVIDRKHSAVFAEQLHRMQRRLQQQAYFSSSMNRRVRRNSDQWLVLGVYISSTFSEFPDEAHLMFRKLFPLVNHRLRAHQVHLVPVMFHTMGDEESRVATTTHSADGPMPIHQDRLPMWRRGRSQGAYEFEGQGGATLWCGSNVEVAEVRELAVRDGCDIFIGLHSDMFNPSCHVTDWNALETSADSNSIPTLLYERDVRGVPMGLQHKFDYSAHVQFQMAEKNHAVEHGNGVKPRLADQAAERKILVNDHVLFRRKVRERVPPFLKHAYEATFTHVDANGLARFELNESFFTTLSQDLFSCAMAYHQKRLSGCCAPPTSIPLEFECPSITRHNWTGGNVKQNPFAHLEHKLGLDDPNRSKDPFFTKSLVDTIMTAPSRESTPPSEGGFESAAEGAPPGTLFQAIYGQRGSGRSTQLRALGTRLQASKEKNSHLVLTHSVTCGKRTLNGVMTSLLRQIVAPGTPTFDGWPAMDDDAALVDAFCDALKRRVTLVPRYVSCLWLLIDDDDAVEFGASFSEAFQIPERRKRLQESLPHDGMYIRVVFTTSSRPAPHDGLTLFQVPSFDELEAADLFVHFLIGIESVPERTMQDVKSAAQYLVLQKKHGLRPLYVYLCAREMLFWNEEVTMLHIAEQLPGTIDELLASTLRGTMPRDMVSVLDALATSPVPVEGALARHAVNPLRSDPAFSAAAARRTWMTKRSWGAFGAPPLSSAALLLFFLANYIHLLRGCTRSRNRGFLNQRRSNFSGNIWRDEWVWLSRTVGEALAVVKKDRRGNGARHGESKECVWQTALLRTCFLRDEVHTMKALSNAFDPLRFFASPHRVFLMLHTRRFDDLRLVLERMLLLLVAENRAAHPSGKNTSLLSGGGASDEPVRITAQNIHSRLNELRISLQFAANDPASLIRAKSNDPLGLLVEYLEYLMSHWPVLTRHPAYLYACPQTAPPLIRASIESSLQAQEHPCAFLRWDASLQFAKKCFETALLLTSHAQEQSKTSSAPQGAATTGRSSSSVGDKTTGDASSNADHTAHGPRLKTFLKSSVVSKSFVAVYRGIADAKPHEITPLMASPNTQLTIEGDADGGAAFGYVGVIVMPPAEPATAAAFGFASASRQPNQVLSKGTYFLSVKAHTNAICALEVVETKHAIRIASAAYFDAEVAITALVVGSSSGASSRLQLVGRLLLENVQRPMLTTISMSPVTKTQVSDNGQDDGQRCPMVAVVVKNLLYVFEGQRFGHDNLYNRKGSIQPQVFSGHDNRIVLSGFSPAGAKVFTIDASGHCFVWGTPESPCCGTILAVTDFGTVPSFARFVDHETVLIVTNRGLSLWNSANSQVQQLLACPIRQPLQLEPSPNFALLHYQPPSYVYGSLEDTELLQLPPHVKVHRLLEQLREKKHPTVTYMAFDGAVFFDTAEKQIKVHRRQHVPPQNELECDRPPLLLFSKEASHVCQVLPQGSTSDLVGNRDVDRWAWSLGSRRAVAIDTSENMIKMFDLLKGTQVPLFFAVRKHESNSAPLFAPCDAVSLAGENEDRVVVAQSDGSLHVVTLTPGSLGFPVPPLTTV